MSYATYSARITPEFHTRSAVAGIAAGCCLAGLISIALLPAPWLSRAGLSVVWLLGSAIGAFRYLRSVKAAEAYEIRSDGGVRVLSAAGRSFEAQLAAGTTVTAHIAWLRFSSPGRATWGELVIGPRKVDKRLKNKEWRRLQVICRHWSAC